MQRIRTSFRLMAQSYRVLMQDKELMLLPVLSGLCIIAVCASFLVPLGLTDPAALESADESAFLLPALLFYIATYTIGFFFQAAVVAGASEHMSGGDPTLGSALRAAGRRFVPLLLWGVVAGTVGMVLRAIQERSALAGKLIAAIVGVAWSLATFFMVPVIVHEDLSLRESFKRSWTTFKQTWGETVVGNAGLSLAAFLIALPLIALCVALFAADLVVAGVALAVAGIVVLAVFFSALQGVWLAAVYRYATTGAAPGGFEGGTIQGAFRAKRS